jgi:hypothetical protein
MTRFAGAGTVCDDAAGAVRTVSAEASTTSRGRDCSAAGLASLRFAGSAAAGLAKIRSVPIAIAQARMASSLTCAKFSERSFRYGFAKWLKGLAESAAGKSSFKKTRVISIVWLQAKTVSASRRPLTFR